MKLQKALRGEEEGAGAGEEGGRKERQMAWLASDRLHRRSKFRNQRILISTWPTGENQALTVGLASRMTNRSDIQAGFRHFVTINMFS